VTEQSKIPLPPEGEGSKEGKSLFERASGAFGLGSFKPAPVPTGLQQPRAKRSNEREAEQQSPPKAASEAPIAVPSAPAAPKAEAPTIAMQSSEAKSEPEPKLEPVRFSGRKHAIDRAHLHEQGLIEPEGAVTALLEEFRIVKRQLLRAAREARQTGEPANAQRVLVCSPLPGEGKTFCATNLALAIAAEKDSEVLLVDADFAKPSVLSVLGLPGGPGLMDALADPTIRVEECVLGTDIPGLWVLPAGNQTTQDSEYLASNRTAEVLDRLTQGAPNRMVIFDSPPALAASPAAELAKYVGQALLIVRADQTGQSSIEDALSLLSTCPDIKLLLNAALFSPSGRRFGAYYGYGG
jgi:exopolysaccharide/PEP-CTERM locus tyrosine autokinase